MPQLSRWVREPFNAISHLVGVILAVAGVGYLLSRESLTIEGAFSFGIFGFGAVAMFGASALYHWTPQVKPRLQKLDHCAIYCMIAGSYTPIALLTLGDSLQWWIFTAQWTLALIGIAATVVMQKTPTWLRLTLYLVMGWMILPLISSIQGPQSTQIVQWMVLGGVFYTVGSVVYATKRPRLWPDRFGFHELWHLFVLGGFGCHFVMMLFIKGF